MILRRCDQNGIIPTCIEVLRDIFTFYLKNEIENSYKN